MSHHLAGDTKEVREAGERQQREEAAEAKVRAERPSNQGSKLKQPRQSDVAKRVSDVTQHNHLACVSLHVFVTDAFCLI
jgi:hypothetical protein